MLGVNWLSSLGPIIWDFNNLTMKFWRHGRQIIWTSLGKPRPDQPRLHTLSPTATMEALLTSFSHLFRDPQGLPPQRRYDHRIHLKDPSKSTTVRPYRYPHLQKAELEKQCQDMLAQGIIRYSTSPFSSPVLLVKKQDGSWRFCVDYRALNDNTLKDKFPIPIIDELLDELEGAKFFTKLDLRSGYHQVRMHPDDIEKTAFRAHHGHFEFLVMPFGLCNAPSTFQALMNDILGPYLQKFVLVFFDDILIYSKTWNQHLDHIQKVFSILQKSAVYLKKSKCSFGQTMVGYLGHIISDQGVAVDPEKIQAISSWPQPTTVK